MKTPTGCLILWLHPPLSSDFLFSPLSPLMTTAPLPPIMQSWRQLSPKRFQQMIHLTGHFSIHSVFYLRVFLWRQLAEIPNHDVNDFNVHPTLISTGQHFSLGNVPGPPSSAGELPYFKCQVPSATVGHLGNSETAGK